MCRVFIVADGDGAEEETGSFLLERTDQADSEK